MMFHLLISPYLHEQPTSLLLHWLPTFASKTTISINVVKTQNTHTVAISERFDRYSGRNLLRASAHPGYITSILQLALILMATGGMVV